MDQASDGPGRKDAPGHSAGALKEAAMEDRLLPLVETEIIPRLMVAHQDQRLQAPHAPEIQARDVAAFSRALMENRMTDATDIVADLCGQGISMDRIYLHLFTPAARYLGELWEADLCTFSEVTLCLWRLQTLLYELSPAFHSAAKNTKPAPVSERRILMATMPGQQHTFGLSMVREFFRRAGWNISGGATDGPVDPARLAKREHFDVVGLSFGDETKLSALGKCISNIRAESMNRAVVIIVGGPLFVAQPSYCELVQADAIITEGREAPAMAQDLVSRFRKSSQRQA